MVEAVDWVSGEGWLSDESDFYGDDDTVQVLETRLLAIDPATSLSALYRSPQALAVASRKPTVASTKPTGASRKPVLAAENPAVASGQSVVTSGKPAVVSAPEKTLYFGCPVHRQSGESVTDFMNRLRPSTVAMAEVGPWIWVHNPYVKSDQNYDMGVLMALGRSLLDQYSQTKSKLEQQMAGKAKGTITRKLKPAREKLEKDLYEAAVASGCLSGKWMFFPTEDVVDGIWSTIAEAVVGGKLGSTAKVATGSGGSNRLICVYTDNFDDKADVRRVLEVLVGLGLVKTGPGAQGITYKHDAYTHWDIVSNNEYGLRASLYRSKEMLDHVKSSTGSTGFDF